LIDQQQKQQIEAFNFLPTRQQSRFRAPQMSAKRFPELLISCRNLEKQHE
jgi:hypothetical protein